MSELDIPDDGFLHSPKFFNSRDDVTEYLKLFVTYNHIPWKDMYERCFKEFYVSRDISKEWFIAACLGQFAMPEDVAKAVVNHFGLPHSAYAWLTIPPIRATKDISQDPLVYRLNEIIKVYGETIKEIVHEDFGDGIMSAIDFKMNVEKEVVNGVERVKLTFSGKYLPYKKF
ncbi:Cyanate lyase, C-terminal domain and Cyanate hydratase family and Lambda repressor-like, DNA-binding domain-containing protein [Strongyloides ratti]|uniref:Cyanate hydratase n=1 Tax=Strongyloides ratti TaxID=34506 RepID=A0A090MYA8_STRRB|nr:Cyanate lyase, C-terminal domain and Cyanate hydratase family and Lambda repressor-like, DNA-binding domain-containing protein [Strongyloides ratti]CEF66859.1 Cyanate lyase, C-terminal domain and Cyanate hydratase family and Lambda repressor-like, DNA-binding domain-containing protein [Strongyloides ratti]